MTRCFSFSNNNSLFGSSGNNNNILVGSSGNNNNSLVSSSSSISISSSSSVRWECGSDELVMSHVLRIAEHTSPTMEPNAAQMYPVSAALCPSTPTMLT